MHQFQSRRSVLFALLGVLPTLRRVIAQESLPAPAPTLSELVRGIVLESVDDEYIDEKKWGKTANRFDGVDIDGLRISKRKQRVNHGFWQRYEVRLIKPEETLKLEIEQEPATEAGLLRFIVTLKLKARCKATFALWTYGVKGINGTTVSNASVNVRLVLETSPKLEFSWDTPLPRLNLHPQVADVNLQLTDLEVDRIGIVTGDLAKLLGEGSQAAVDSALQGQSRKIRKKLQAKIDRETGSK
ncbi:hypothetical protein [Planctomicrobium sp. SH664]|uniref:hypothetical protein n=1 Tax=Planctomicrobium sp. SH664 TaxID=3448125 RepID=UPI003F5B0CDC